MPKKRYPPKIKEKVCAYDGCNNVFIATYASFCPECRKKARSEIASKESREKYEKELARVNRPDLISKKKTWHGLLCTYDLTLNKKKAEENEMPDL